MTGFSGAAFANQSNDLVDQATAIIKTIDKEAKFTFAGDLKNAAGVAIFPMVEEGNKAEGVVLARKEGHDWCGPLFVTIQDAMRDDLAGNSLVVPIDEKGMKALRADDSEAGRWVNGQQAYLTYRDHVNEPSNLGDFMIAPDAELNTAYYSTNQTVNQALSIIVSNDAEKLAESLNEIQ